MRSLDARIPCPALPKGTHDGGSGNRPPHGGGRCRLNSLAVWGLEGGEAPARPAGYTRHEYDMNTTRISVACCEPAAHRTPTPDRVPDTPARARHARTAPSRPPARRPPPHRVVSSTHFWKATCSEICMVRCGHEMLIVARHRCRADGTSVEAPHSAASRGWGLPPSSGHSRWYWQLVAGAGAAPLPGLAAEDHGSREPARSRSRLNAPGSCA